MLSFLYHIHLYIFPAVLKLCIIKRQFDRYCTAWYIRRWGMDVVLYWFISSVSISKNGCIKYYVFGI